MGWISRTKSTGATPASAALTAPGAANSTQALSTIVIHHPRRWPRENIIDFGELIAPKITFAPRTKQAAIHGPVGTGLPHPTRDDFGFTSLGQTAFGVRLRNSA